jgi:hypothetical protein
LARKQFAREHVMHVCSSYPKLAHDGLDRTASDFGGTVLSGSPGEFGKLIAEETEKWAKVVKFAGMKQA